MNNVFDIVDSLFVELNRLEPIIELRIKDEINSKYRHVILKYLVDDLTKSYMEYFNSCSDSLNLYSEYPKIYKDYFKNKIYYD